MLRCVFLTLLIVSVNAAAQEQIVFATDAWPDFIDEEGGYYQEVLTAIYQPKGYEVVFRSVPYQRAVNMIAAGKSDIMAGAYLEENIQGIYASLPIDVDIVDIALRPEMGKSWQGVDSLMGKKVGAVKNRYYDKNLSSDIYYKEGTTLAALLKMLSAGRLDAVLSYEDDILIEQKLLGGEAEFVVQKSVIVSPTFFVFADTERGRKFSKIFNQGVLALYKSGKLREMMKNSLGNLKYFPKDATFK